MKITDSPTPMSDEDGYTYLTTRVSVLSDYLLYRIDYNERIMLRETGEVIILTLSTTNSHYATLGSFSAQKPLKSCTPTNKSVRF